MDLYFHRRSGNLNFREESKFVSNDSHIRVKVTKQLKPLRFVQLKRRVPLCRKIYTIPQFINVMTDNNVGRNEFTSVTEGKATILFPKDQVFYNPVQQFNRDLSVAVIRTWSESPILTKKQLRKAAWEQKRAEASSGKLGGTEEQTNGSEDGSDVLQRRITVLEALSATGLRAIRYALEIPAIQAVLANDMSPSAIKAIQQNIAHNNIPPNLVQATCSDANALMYSHRTERIDVIDLDPYGTATPFIDSAIQAISSDGLLCVTCTDMSVTAGQGYPEKCFASYGGLPVKQEYTHEVVHPNLDERLI
jgi:tRNA (guanine26-N2/guanine27-N2)-dimethyltransferase